MDTPTGPYRSPLRANIPDRPFRNPYGVSPTASVFERNRTLRHHRTTSHNETSPNFGYDGPFTFPRRTASASRVENRLLFETPAAAAADNTPCDADDLLEEGSDDIDPVQELEEELARQIKMDDDEQLFESQGFSITGAPIDIDDSAEYDYDPILPPQPSSHSPPPSAFPALSSSSSRHMTTPYQRRRSSSSSSSSNSISNITSIHGRDSLDRAQQPGQGLLLWPYLLPAAEWIYVKLTYMLFMVVFMIKETLFTMVSFADTAVFGIVMNGGLLLLRPLGFCRHRQPVNPFRVRRGDGKEERHSNMVFRALATLIYVGIGAALVLRYNGDGGGGGSSSSSSSIGKSFMFPGEAATDGSPGAMLARYDVEAIRAAVQSILPSYLPVDPKTGRIDFTEAVHAYLEDRLDTRYVQRAELQEQDGSATTAPAPVPVPAASAVNEVLMPDFALATVGARVIPQLTSATFDKGKGWRSSFARLLGMQPSYDTGVRSPIMALLPDTHAGQCWPMAGNDGYLGVLLTRPVPVNAVTVEYVARHQALNMSSAPKDFQVWGLTTDRFSRLPWQSGVADNSTMLMGKFVYDILKPTAIQTFKIEPVSPTVKAVVFRFMDNWGSDTHTCIYRVRVHGNPVQDDGEQ